MCKCGCLSEKHRVKANFFYCDVCRTFCRHQALMR